MLMTPPTGRTRHASPWLQALRLYLGIIAIGNLAWEFLHLPLYTIWTTGTRGEQVFAAVHCAVGDLLIASTALIGALLICGNQAWPRRHFWRVAGVAIACGLAYTVFSEWLNVELRRTWTYSASMPVVSIGGLRIGLSPLLQWLIVPGAAFAIMRKWTSTGNKGGQQ